MSTCWRTLGSSGVGEEGSSPTVSMGSHSSTTAATPTSPSPGGEGSALGSTVTVKVKVKDKSRRGYLGCCRRWY